MHPSNWGDVHIKFAVFVETVGYAFISLACSNLERSITFLITVAAMVWAKRHHYMPRWNSTWTRFVEEVDANALLLSLSKLFEKETNTNQLAVEGPEEIF